MYRRNEFPVFVDTHIEFCASSFVAMCQSNATFGEKKMNGKRVLGVEE